MEEKTSMGRIVFDISEVLPELNSIYKFVDKNIDLGDIALFDIIEGASEGKALDMMEGTPHWGVDNNIKGYTTTASGAYFFTFSAMSFMIWTFFERRVWSIFTRLNSTQMRKHSGTRLSNQLKKTQRKENLVKPI